MRLHLANVTRQRQTVFYRLDFIHEGNAAQRVNSLKHIVVEPGRQVTVGGDLTLPQVQSIMDQLSPYGGVGIEELSRLPQHKIAYLLSVDKPIPSRAIKLIDEHNSELLTYAGDKRRQDAAIATHPMVERQIDNLKRLDIEMLEVPPEAGDPDTVGKPLDFGAHLDPNARDSTRAPPARRGKTGRR
jgi:hypothetical protein